MSEMILELNNFESFDRYLFGEGKKDWGKYYDEGTNVFTPPIKKLRTIEEYQLCHYVLWMVIGEFRLRKKPIIASQWGPISRYYLCHFVSCHGGFSLDCARFCPLNLEENAYRYNYRCGEAYTYWCHSENDAEVSLCADEIAHYEWRRR